VSLGGESRPLTITTPVASTGLLTVRGYPSTQLRPDAAGERRLSRAERTSDAAEALKNKAGWEPGAEGSPMSRAGLVPEGSATT
jgi:hypothetical protein